MFVYVFMSGGQVGDESWYLFPFVKFKIKTIRKYFIMKWNNMDISWKTE